MLDLKFQGFINTAEIADKKWYRIQYGEFASATAARDFLKKSEGIDAFHGAFVQVASESVTFKNTVSTVEIQPEPAKNEEQRAPTATLTEVKDSKAEEETADQGLFGDWLGAKSWLSDQGINYSLSYKGEFVQNFSGGVEEDTAYLGNTDVKMDFDLDKIMGASGLKLYLYALGIHGDDPSSFVGDSFATSNIEGPNVFKLYEVYLEKTLDEQFILSAGAIDLNASYYVTQDSLPFFNSAFGISPSLSETGENGPSIFPVTALAANMKFESKNHFYFQTGVFNALSGNPDYQYDTRFSSGTSEGLLNIYELGYLNSNEDQSTQYSVGAWNYTKPADRVDGSEETDTNWGFYGMINQPIIDKLTGFVKYGMAKETVNETAAATEIGLTYSGICNSRPDDILGLAWAQKTYSIDHRTASDLEKYESVIEVLYDFQVTNGLHIIPDYQLVSNPSGSKTIKDASVGTVRIALDF